ncbi:hypothetical protein HanRHA438_Chr13g0602101 [Helianthus annuus]|uniref:Uncharacterized protein n=1 Tax=Helianthus annuus TaxID=4232 RepID=A0A251U3U1_HELAN|nr:uncharacterized protein LOC110872163 [Helianthus annuus]KAJ0477147.1 hypothetical protein HanHA300_Chr13g0485051 [Helianthus annuus]KAJ0481535.1 hypothetical protein HanIR_Chr13g0643581 [Helianthus annuus]KAJ0497983.1 hypothetical protein HanHA89_Chr13g0517201 [Helianthus annuus]KAJ0663985.1 hypothetical protein HanLR1_Chr13g0487061 [Helianthus annuus]KAJ0671471.1 hypothetical protein HanOQP8_Chr13g0485811 [Helianthus annuus]
MESKSQKVEVIKQAIKQVMEEGGTDDDRLLSKLMSQLDSEPEPNSALSNSRSDEDEEEKILKELKKVRRQNVVTHCLLSVMILLTVTWQISEVSIILKLKNGVAHPFRSIGSILLSMIKPHRPQLDKDNDTLITEASNLIESTPVHDLKLPKLPHLELPKINLGLNDQD